MSCPPIASPTRGPVAYGVYMPRSDRMRHRIPGGNGGGAFMAKVDPDNLPDVESEQAFEVIISQARIRLEMPQLMARALDCNPELVHRAIREWANHSRPLSDIADDLRRTLGEG